MAKKKTRETKAIEALLRKHFPGWPENYPPEVYRYSTYSIRVRLVHKCFEGKDRGDREDMVMPLLRTLPEETQADISILLLLAPNEVNRSIMNMEFEKPTPSAL